MLFISTCKNEKQVNIFVRSFKWIIHIHNAFKIKAQRSVCQKYPINISSRSDRIQIQVAFVTVLYETAVQSCATETSFLYIITVCVSWERENKHLLWSRWRFITHIYEAYFSSTLILSFETKINDIHREFFVLKYNPQLDLMTYVKWNEN